MKQRIYLLMLLVLLAAYGQAESAILVREPDGTHTSKLTLAAAIASPATAGKTILVTTPLTAVQSNISSATVHQWPADRTLKFEGKGSLGNTTIFRYPGDTSGWPDAQIFTGSGVVGGVKTWKPVWRGAKGDWTTDDLVALRNVALSLPAKVIFADGATYKISSSVTWGDNIEFAGSGSVIKATGSTGFILGHNTKMKGLTFDFTASSGTFWALNSSSKTGLDVDGCKFINGRVYLQNLSGVSAGKVRIANSTFVTDFSAVDYEGSQYDVISLYGQQGFDISNNSFSVTNVHRVIKLSDAVYSGQPVDVVSPFNTRSGVISGNTITGATTSNKQVVDMYNGTSDVVITKNIIDVSGFSSIFENKTSGGTSNGTPISVTIVDNPLLRNNKQIVTIQGAVGSVTPGADNHLQSLILTGNTMRSGSATDSAVEVRFQSTAIIGGNNIEMTGATNIPALKVMSCIHADIHNNSLVNGTLELAKVTTDGGGVNHSGDFGNAIVEGNSITRWANANAGINLTSINTPTANLIFRNNFVAHGSVTSGLNRFMYANGVTANTVRKEGNVFVGANASPIFASPTNVLRVSIGNSWEPTLTYSATVPVSQVYLKGSRVENNSGTIGQPAGWRVTTAGGAYYATRANFTAYTEGTWVKWDSGTTVWECSTAGTSAGAAPSIVGAVVGDTVVDGGVVWTMRSTTAAAFTSEGNL